MTEPRPLKVFLCHASADKPAVRKLYRYLRERKMDPWLDAEKLLPGQNWQVEIPKALLSSDVIIICLSKNSVDKEGYVQKEIKFALDKALEMPEGRIFLIPARLEECELPHSLSTYHYVNLFEDDGYKRLLRSLRVRAEQIGAAKVSVNQDTIPPDVEKTAREKAEREKVEREKAGEAAEKTVREKAEREAFGKARRENLEPTVGQIANLSRTTTQKKEQKKKPARKFNFRKIGIIGLLSVVLLFGLWALIYYIINVLPVVPSPTPIFAPTTNSITMISEKDGMALVFVPAGEFTMGSDANIDEQPIHKVALASYWIDQTEVTNKMYSLCVQAGACQSPSSMGSYTRKEYFGVSEFDDYPVIYVDWNKSQTYCEWAGRRLPTEAEWEKAARGTDARFYPWGNNAPDNNFLNYNSNIDETTEVGKYPAGASIYGALDMAGNVWEWVSSLHQSYPYSASDGRENLGASGSRVLRGGSWVNMDNFVRSAYRNWNAPAGPSNNIGFRCALSP